MEPKKLKKERTGDERFRQNNVVFGVILQKPINPKMERRLKMERIKMRKRRNSGFSIVELLILMAIIAMVILMLLPVANRIRHRIKSYQQQTEDKQIVGQYVVSSLVITDANMPKAKRLAIGQEFLQFIHKGDFPMLLADADECVIYDYIEQKKSDYVLYSSFEEDDPNARAAAEEALDKERELLAGLLEFRDSGQKKKEETLTVAAVTADTVSDAEQTEGQLSVEYAVLETSEAEPQAGFAEKVLDSVKGFPEWTCSKVRSSDRSQVALALAAFAIPGFVLVCRKRRHRLNMGKRRGLSRVTWLVIGLVIVVMVFAIAKPVATKSLALETGRKIRENLPAFFATLFFLTILAVLRRQSTRMKGISANQDALSRGFKKMAIGLGEPGKLSFPLGVKAAPSQPSADNTKQPEKVAQSIKVLSQSAAKIEGSVRLLLPDKTVRRKLARALQEKSMEDLEMLKAAGRLTPETTSNLDDEKNTAHHLAMMFGSPKAARFLCDNGLASDDVDNKDDKTPEDLMFECLGVAAVNNKVGPFDDFWDNGFLTEDNIDNSIEGLEWEYLVDAAAYHSSWDVVIWIWEGTNAGFNTKAFEGKTTMEWVIQGLVDVIEDGEDNTEPFEKVLTETNMLEKEINKPVDDDKNTFCHLAMNHGAAGIAALLMENGAGLDELNNDGETPENRMLGMLAEVACNESDDDSVFRKFLEASLLNDENITKEVPGWGKNLAGIALEYDSVNIATLLMENNGFGQPEEQSSIYPVVSSLSADAMDNKTERFTKFLEAGLLNGQNINSPVDGSGKTLASVAADSGSLDVAALLSRNGARFDEPEIDSKTPESMLMKSMAPAVKADNFQALRTCLEIGNLSSKLGDPLDVFKNTLLHIAFKDRDSVNAAAVLINNGASLDAKNESGETPRSLRNDRLVKAAKSGDMPMLQKYLDSGLFKVNDPVDREGRNVLDIALESDNTRTASQLISSYDARARYVTINSRIRKAIEADSPELLQKYRDARLFNFNEKRLDEDGNTTAHLAVKGKKKKVVTWLQQQGVSFGIRNYNDETANQLMQKMWTQSL